MTWTYDTAVQIQSWCVDSSNYIDFAAQITLETDATGDTIFYLMNETSGTVIAKSVSQGLTSNDASSLSLFYKGSAAGNTTYGLYIISIDGIGTPETATMEL